MAHIITMERSSYNFRRYGKPWIAKVVFAAGGKANFEWGQWVGSAENGGTLVVEVAEGDIVASGQKDGRGRGDDTAYYQVRNGKLVQLANKGEAYKLATTPAPTSEVEAPVDPYGLTEKSMEELEAMLAAITAELAGRK